MLKMQVGNGISLFLLFLKEDKEARDCIRGRKNCFLEPACSSKMKLHERIIKNSSVLSFVTLKRSLSAIRDSLKKNYFNFKFFNFYKNLTI